MSDLIDDGVIPKETSDAPCRFGRVERPAFRRQSNILIRHINALYNSVDKTLPWTLALRDEADMAGICQNVRL
ncbi:MAG TPA: hypothetical protein VHT68_27120 [Pseudolabrys sp.]|nr:hypothetical protein [Pseudolabrys sp.]